MKQIKLSLYFMGLVALASCDKNSDKKENLLEKFDAGKSNITTMSGVGDGVEAFYTFLQTPSNGSFGLVNVSSYGAVPYRPRTASVAGARAAAAADRGHGHYEFTGAFYDGNQKVVPGGSVSFGPITIAPDPARGNMYLQNSFGGAALTTSADYNAIAGQTVNFTLNPNAPGLPVSGSLYIPQRMAVKIGRENPDTDGGSTGPRPFPLLGNMFNRWESTVNNVYGCELGWIADPQNNSGVVVSVEYDAENSKQVFPESPAGDRKRYVAFRVPDNGKFIIPNTVYSTLFPGVDVRDGLKAIVMVSVGRANYTMASNSADAGRKYSVYTASVIEVPVMISLARSNRPRT